MSMSPPRWMCLGCVLLLLGPPPFSSASSSADLDHTENPSVSGDLFQVGPVEGDWQQESVTAILQSHDGYLWLGTYHGLVRFDGVSFSVFDSGNTPELPNGRITSLYESPDRVLWVGHETGQLTRVANGRFQAVNLRTNWAGVAIQAISSDERGDLWLMNAFGALIRVRDGRTALAPGGGSRLLVTTLARTKNGKLWMAANGRIATLDGGKVAPMLFPGDIPTNIYERVFTAADGGVWVLEGGRLRKWRDGGWVVEVKGFPPAVGAVSAVVETRSGLLVGTSREGLYLLRFGAEPIHFSRADGLSHDWIRALGVDQEGNCWVGTGTGFDGLRPRKVRMLAPPDGWQGCSVLSFSVRSDDTAWVGTEGAGLYRYDGREWKVVGEAAGFRGSFVWSVLETKEHELFVGTWGQGLHRWNGDRFESPGDLGRITAPVAAMYQGRGGELWIGTQEGLYRHEAGRFVWSAGKEKLALPDVRTITESPDGTLWFGMSGGGLGCLRDGALKQFRKADGLGSDLVSCLYADADGTLWIGTTDNGLTRLTHGKFSVISSAQGLPSKIICHVVDDAVGHLWIGSQGGILRVGKAELHRCADGEVGSVHCLSYGRAEGMTVQACAGGFQPGACRTADGRLWFPTVKGIAIVDPANVTTNAVPPPVVIESLLVDGTATNWLNVEGESSNTPASAFAHTADSATAEAGRPPAQAPGNALRIPPGHRRFEFHYAGLSFVAPDKVRFRRMLEGLEHEWVDAGIKRVAEYSYLPPGQYTFRVIACNNDDLWNKTGATVAFTVLPFFYQTLWFRIVSLLAGGCAITGTVLWVARRRLRRKLELLERQRAIERERARIARDIHDDLGASLTRISLLSETIRGEISGQPQVAADLEHIRGIAREGTRAMDEIVWAVNPQYDTLDSLVAYLGRYAERYLNTAGIRCRLDVPVHLPAWTLSAEIRHNVFLTLKEALHNVVKHAQATEVRVSVELAPAGFVVLVADNGRGFVWRTTESGHGLASEPDRAATGNGLANMRKRMEEIGSTCTWDTAPQEGTRVRLSVVVKPESRPLPAREA